MMEYMIKLASKYPDAYTARTRISANNASNNSTSYTMTKNAGSISRPVVC